MTNTDRLYNDVCNVIDNYNCFSKYKAKIGSNTNDDSFYILINNVPNDLYAIDLKAGLEKLNFKKVFYTNIPYKHKKNNCDIIIRAQVK